MFLDTRGSGQETDGIFTENIMGSTTDRNGESRIPSSPDPHLRFHPEVDDAL